MLVSTEAIALSTIKYSESSIIFKCYTLSYGIKTYMIRGVRSKKNKSNSIALFQPLTILEINANHKNNFGIENINSAKILIPYKSIPFDILKNSLVLFLSEILSKCIIEEEQNKQMYNYIKSSLLWLDSASEYVNFHIQFLIKLLKYLGISPSFEKINKLYGYSNDVPKRVNDLKEKVEDQLKNDFAFLLGTNFDANIEHIINYNKRKKILEFLMAYMQLHIEGFKRPNSLNIMYELFKKK